MYRLAALIVFVVVTVAAVVTKVPGTYNFDNVFYLGVAEQIRGSALDAAHQSAYAEAKAALPAADYNKILTDGTPDDLVRIPSAADAEVYGEQLPFYSVKPIYPLLIAGFRCFGINGVVASYWISAVSLGLMASLCCLWLSRHFSVPVAATVALLIAFSSGVFNLGVDPRPDALYAAVVIGTLMLAMRSARLSGTLIALMLLSMLVRPDAIILCIAMCGAWMVIRPGEYRRPVIGLLACLALYIAVTRIVGAYSWPTLMYHAYINYLPHPRTHPYVVHASDLVRIYLKFGQPLFSQSFLTMVLLAVLALLAACATTPPRSPLSSFAAAIVVTLPLHFLVHPSDNLRVRGAYYIAAFIFLLIAISKAAVNAPPTVRRWLLPRQTEPPLPGGPTGRRRTDLPSSHSPGHA